MTDNGDLVSRFAEREAAVLSYQKLWWAAQDEPQRSFLQTRPALRRGLLLNVAAGANFVATADVYRDEDGWAGEREKLHEELLLRLTDSTGVPSTASSAVYITMGLPGSGKTSGLRPLVLAHAEVTMPAAVSDADEVRTSFPEYASGLGSGVLQEETQVLTYGGFGYPVGGGLQERVEAIGGIVVVDVVGSPSHLPEVVNRLASTGRDVFILMSECPVEICVSRAMDRAVKPGGRYVPLSVIRSKVGVPRAALVAALRTGSVAGWGVVDTSGATARLVEGDGTFDCLGVAA
ncbi:zeta toxin family protein [Modestobacter sp. Leaf380]|uniref:zeta toxin family protein n=1 Tax=Modestobacter sp. Leaf380 TaxID=1736356 RepID=UPI0006F2896C|nr:zeta toxin family protein [Modestobacter sp. Leaf380]KQS67593.1 hypothetical protein ASG41_22660 [Modestobacter sp. Leaf380]